MIYEDIYNIVSYFERLIKKTNKEIELYAKLSDSINYEWTNGKKEFVKGCAITIGVWVRVKEGYGYCYCSNLKEIEKTIQRAERIGAIWPCKRELNCEKQIVVEDVEEETTHEKLEEMEKTLQEEKNELATLHLAKSTTTLAKVIYNSIGGEKIELSQKHRIYCKAIAKDSFNYQQKTDVLASLKPIPLEKIKKMITKTKEKAIFLLSSKKTSISENLPIILDPKMTGVFTHEVVGHASEEDAIREGDSILADYKNKKLAIDELNIVDSPSSLDFGHYSFDDEGFRGQDVFIIKKGVFVDTLRSSIHGPSNGHGRAQSPAYKPLVRMSNTYLLPGKAKKEDLFDCEKAIYLVGCRGGSVDTFKGEFIFAAEEAYLMERGEKKKVLRDVSISGDLLHALNSIELIGSDFATSPGFCGKNGQYVPVSDGGPHLRIKEGTLRVI